MYLIPKDTELSLQYLTNVLQQFQTKDLPVLKKLKRYYDGKHQILQKKATDDGKPCNKIITNYTYSITQNYLGYLSGIPIRYENDNFNDVIEIINYNDPHQEDVEYLRNALIFGKAFEICYLDEDGKIRFRLFDTRECIPIYSNDLNNELLYVIRFYREDVIDKNNQKYIVEVYGSESTKIYRSTPGFNSFEFIEEQQNYFNQCPVTVFSLNKDEKSIFDQIISLQDAYNDLLSGEVDDFDQFADAYLLLKGVVADDDNLKAMKKNRVLMVDTDADAKYLTKSISDTQVENMLKNINDQIHKITNSPDFNDEKFMAQSGIAMRYKLVGFENQAADIEAYMRKAIQRRIELICSILSLTDDEQKWRDVNIIFTRNLPQSLEPSSISELMQLKGLVSDKTLLSQLPFVNNVDEELEAVQNEKVENMDIYNFSNPVIESDEED